MHQLPQLHEPRGANTTVHLLLGIAALFTLWNLFTTIDQVQARKDLIARTLFHSAPADASTIAVARAKANAVTNLEPQAPNGPTPQRVDGALAPTSVPATPRMAPNPAAI